MQQRELQETALRVLCAWCNNQNPQQADLLILRRNAKPEEKKLAWDALAAGMVARLSPPGWVHRIGPSAGDSQAF